MYVICKWHCNPVFSELIMTGVFCYVIDNMHYNPVFSELIMTGVFCYLTDNMYYNSVFSELQVGLPHDDHDVCDRHVLPACYPHRPGLEPVSGLHIHRDAVDAN